MDWTTALENHFRQEGFDGFGISDIQVGVESELFKNHYQLFLDWISHGQHGEMRYLERRQKERSDPRLLFPKAKTILSLSYPYPRKLEQSNTDHEVRYARYLYGDDYHEKLREKIDGVLRNFLNHENFINWKNVHGALEFQSAIDTRPLLERTWAKINGLGWIGKNTLLIHPKNGSFSFLAHVLINWELPQTAAIPAQISDLCGNCRACIESCPTEALSEKGIESDKCISYFTLEKKSLTLDPSIDTGKFIAGCDICQEVCPFNFKPMKYAETTASDPTLVTDLSYLEMEDEESYRKRIRGKALERVPYAKSKINLAQARTFQKPTSVGSGLD